MGKETGFMLFDRVAPKKRPVQERINDYQEFVQNFDAEELNHQAARCMDCGIPFCHSGCPLGNVIPDFNDAVYKKDWRQAYEILISTNNFPEFTGRICPAPCETACVLGINAAPVNIEEIEKHIIEIAFEKGYVKAQKSLMQSGFKVAIIGSGPAGLACADQLCKAGHSVTVYERDDKPGGLLRYGIPDFKLEKSIVDRRVELMKESGVNFVCNTYVGKDINPIELYAQFDAVVLSGGSTVPRDLKVEGREANGVYFAMQFLKDQNKNVNDPSLRTIDVKGKNVIVIGGGDTGSDCIGTSVRQGASSITQLELLPTPPQNRTKNMPWPTYPMLLKTTSSHEEGCNREWAIVTKQFLKGANGNLTGIKVVKLDWSVGVNGSPSKFTEVPQSEQIIECDFVFLAMGFERPEHDAVINPMNIEINERGNVAANDKTYCTNIEKIFVAGDMRRGQSLVVWAINEGRECAAKVDEYLRKEA